MERLLLGADAFRWGDEKFTPHVRTHNFSVPPRLESLPELTYQNTEMVELGAIAEYLVTRKFATKKARRNMWAWDKKADVSNLSGFSNTAKFVIVHVKEAHVANTWLGYQALGYQVSARGWGGGILVPRDQSIGPPPITCRLRESNLEREWKKFGVGLAKKNCCRYTYSPMMPQPVISDTRSEEIYLSMLTRACSEKPECSFA